MVKTLEPIQYNPITIPCPILNKTLSITKPLHYIGALINITCWTYGNIQNNAHNICQMPNKPMGKMLY